VTDSSVKGAMRCSVGMGVLALLCVAAARAQPATEKAPFKLLYLTVALGEGGQSVKVTWIDLAIE